MKSASTNRPDPRHTDGKEHVINVAMPIEVHRKLLARAGENQRSVRGHVLWLIKEDVKEAA